MNPQFSDFMLPEALARGLTKAGFETPTPVQAQVIPLAQDGVDLLVSAATGSGKTAAFLLPIMQQLLDARAPRSATRALILVPTRELARQIYIHFMRLASVTRLTAGVIIGGERRDRQIAVLRRNPDILVATPGRLLEYIQASAADLTDLEVLVLDEADRMLDMGFAEDVLTIIGFTNPARQSLLFSATLHHKGLSSITDRLLRDPQVLVINPVRESHPDIAHQVILSDDTEHKQQQLLWLLQNEPAEKVLIFTNTRERAIALGPLLVGQGQRTVVLHGELDQRERNRVMGLVHGGAVRILVATDVAARGLDIPGVQLVINFELARSGDDYLHRTGRTGRAGEKGLAIALVGPKDWNLMESIERYLGLSFQARAIPGLKAKFSGPTKRKGPRKSPSKANKAAPATEKPKVKERERDRKAIGKRRKPTASAQAGLSPLRKQGS
ncbi:DEAD/DEAH box helicase [uncultured Thiodictyon sp.]|uniref:DEAD/DEAH box helicase n=1 Tax=uncultured Thiodictyon sp. TaxID=1846217 RepID=UPI0025E08E5B|nr:DEAD/DEAH box helicase [uncultured Thiodictyon sp.]